MGGQVFSAEDVSTPLAGSSPKEIKGFMGVHVFPLPSAPSQCSAKRDVASRRRRALLATVIDLRKRVLKRMAMRSYG